MRQLKAIALLLILITQTLGHGTVWAKSTNLINFITTHRITLHKPRYRSPKTRVCGQLSVIAMRKWTNMKKQSNALRRRNELKIKKQSHFIS